MQVDASADALVPTIDAGIPTHRDLDILFVLDNSFGMGEEQAALIAAFPTFMAQLDARFGGRPNLHIGVVSSDVGAGGFTTGQCDGDGDDGLLQDSPRVINCSPPADPFIEDVASGDNYAGDISEVFECIAALGTTGCGFEQHLESMMRALDGSQVENAAFLRPEAYLAVVILADEDDCSAANGQMFNPDPSVVPVFGPFSSFRCTEFGVTCDGMAVTRETASYSSCNSADSGYLRSAAEYSAFLQTLRTDTSKLLAVVIVGSDQPFDVEATGPNSAALRRSCSTALGDPVPGVRLRDFQAAFGAHGLMRSLCAADLAADMSAVANFIADGML